MTRILFFLLLIPFFVFADSNQTFSENEDPTIFHHVNVITGNLNISFQDAVVQGAQPIPIRRIYSSAGALERTPKNFDLILRAMRGGWVVQGGWNLLPHTHLFIETHHDRKEFSGIGHCNLFIADHGFLEPTYRKAWKGHITELKKTFNFYEGLRNDQMR